MNWPDLIRALLSFFGPLLLEWLEKLLSRAVAELSGPVPTDPAVAVHDVFAAARAKLWAWQFARRRALAAAERVALRRSAELARAALGRAEVPRLTGYEVTAITGE